MFDVVEKQMRGKLEIQHAPEREVRYVLFPVDGAEAKVLLGRAIRLERTAAEVERESEFKTRKIVVSAGNWPQAKIEVVGLTRGLTEREFGELVERVRRVADTAEDLFQIGQDTRS